MSVEGYTVALPPGWSRVPLRHGTDRAIDGLVDTAFSGVPPDSATAVRHDLRRRLRQAAQDAAEQHGLDLYLPTASRDGAPIAASFVVSELRPDAPPADGDHSSQVLERLSGDPGAQVVELPAGRAVRRSRLVAGKEPSGPDDLQVATRRVDYVLPIPSRGSSFVLVSFSTPGDGDAGGALADVLVELFDAVMTTFRWR